MHIVLDLDETLIHAQICMNSNAQICMNSNADFNFELSGVTYYISKRPGLTNFLNFAFGHFESVSVWTAATAEYAHMILQHIMTRAQRSSLLFLKTRNDLQHHPEKNCKPLQLMFDDARAKNIKMRSTNTIMIDDRENVMAANYGNGLLIPAWNGNKDDIALYQLIIILKIILDNNLRMGNFDRVIKLSDIVITFGGSAPNAPAM